MSRLLFINANYITIAKKVNILTELDYTLTDEDFIPINQETIYFSIGDCPADNEVTFSSKYEKLKTLLEDKDTLIFGYECYDQVQALCDTVRANHLDTIDFVCFDLYTAYGEITRHKNPMDLESVYQDCEQKVGYTHWTDGISNSDKMKVILQGLCYENKKEPYDIESICFDFHGDIYTEDFDYDYVKVRKETPGIGKNITFDWSIARNKTLTNELIDKAIEKGYRYVEDASKSDYIICLDSKYKETASENVKKPYLGSIITLLEFTSFIG